MKNSSAKNTMAKNKITNLSQIEKEVIFLKAVYELINSMVNYEIMDWMKDGLKDTYTLSV
jgi:hypothetical protein